MADTLVPTDALSTWVSDAIAKLVEDAYNPDKLQRLQEATANAVAKGQTIAHGATAAAVDARHGDSESLAEKVEQVASSIVGTILAHLVGHMLGVDVPKDAARSGGLAHGDSTIGRLVGSTVLEVLKIGGTELKPGEEGAQRLIGSLAGMAIKGWFESIVIEEAESLHGFLHPIEKIGELTRDVVSATGIDELGRLALRPLGLVTIAKPLEWQANKTYRPSLLGPASVARQWARGRWDWSDVVEELARQGYDEARIDALINETRKFLGVGDVRQLLQYEHFTQDQALAYLGEAGYDSDAAQLALRVEGTKRIEQQNNAIAAMLAAAYASRDIDDGELEAHLAAINMPAAERAFTIEIAQTRRALNIKRLTPAEVAPMVKSKVLSIVDYRAALRRDGYPEFDVAAKELQLLWEIDQTRTVAQQRADMEHQRAIEQQQRDADRAAKLAAADAARQLARRGDEGDLEDAAIRGLIPFARVEEVYRARYDTDTVGVLVDRLESKRQDYLAAQQQREDAAKRGANRGISIGELERAVLLDQVDLGTYRRRLEAQGFPAADVEILVRTLSAELAAKHAAEKKRADAERAAASRSIDLSKLEQLVRRGVRTMPQYAAQLRSLGFNEAAVADMVALLQLQIGDDQATRATRADGEATLNARGLSLEEFRRAVILGLHSIDEFAELLMTQHFTSDKQELLVTELEQDVADAEAARARREQADDRGASRVIPLSTLARAARLGLISPARYQARLVEDGYNDADTLLEMDLLTTEIADVQTARAQRDQVEPAAKARGLSLAELATAVKKGLKQLGDYRARALELGLSPDAADTVTRILGDEVRELHVARDRRDQVAGALNARSISLAEYEAAVRQGLRTLDDYGAQLEAWGFSSDDAALLMGLLGDEL